MQISLKFGIYAYRFFGNLELVLFLILQKKTYNKPTHIAQTEEPWSRLHDTATVSSTQRSILNCTQTPDDSLDLQLNAVYDHHKNCFWSKNQILYQKETVSEDHRKEANLETEEAGNGITMWVDKQRRSIRIS
ncbi:protein C1orf194 homolog [Neolamprologus brichardi]|uniref:protein C1orf194 homolog n=1 Tax=Neolamprologus brichardi TaxID=32507 RepID=UPI001643B140|nr:protein C1orf194 homolog [Neolamprologus brichardi]